MNKLTPELLDKIENSIPAYISDYAKCEITICDLLVLISAARKYIDLTKQDEEILDYKCDCEDCDEKPTFVCCCDRCRIEPFHDEKYHSCPKHLEEAANVHFRVRGRSANWKVI